jgi:hypothetical protein
MTALVVAAAALAFQSDTSFARRSVRGAASAPLRDAHSGADLIAAVLQAAGTPESGPPGADDGR